MQIQKVPTQRLTIQTHERTAPCEVTDCQHRQKLNNLASMLEVLGLCPGDQGQLSVTIETACTKKECDQGNIQEASTLQVQ